MTNVATFTVDWFTGPAVFGPGSWLTHVAPLLTDVPSIRWLEIGSYEGRSALWTASNLLHSDNDRIVCVDPWPPGWSDEAEKLFDQNTAHDRRIVKMRGESEKLLPLLRDHSFHAAYVDGLHGHDAVLFDAREVIRLLKSGGIVIFDDYKNDPAAKIDKDWGVMSAVDQFLHETGSEIEVRFKGWQLIAKLKGELR
jgi:predicted O-methyltransferase YrrM